MRIEDFTFSSNHIDRLVHDIGKWKSQGWVILNGNVRSEWDFINFTRHFLWHPYNKWGYQNSSRKVLLVTAGFNNGEEYSEGHIREYYYQHGIKHVENLGVLTELNNFRHSPEGHYVKSFYDFLGWMNNREDLQIPNADLHYWLHSFVAEIRHEYPAMQVYDLFYAHLHDLPNQISRYWDKVPVEARQERIESVLDFAHRYPEYRHTMRDMIHDFRSYDDHFFATWHHCTEQFFRSNSGLFRSQRYNRVREMLGNRITSSASIYLWGGNWIAMLNAIKFFRLEDKFRQALEDQANFCGMSAGTMILGDRVYDLNPRSSRHGYLVPQTTGMGMIKSTTPLTHIHDFDYIRQKDFDVISSMSLRIPRPLSGLTTNSVALIDYDRDIWSIGGDPVFLLDQRGFYYHLNPGHGCLRR